MAWPVYLALADGSPKLGKYSLSPDIRICLEERASKLFIEFNGPSTASTPDRKILVWKKNYPAGCLVRCAPGGLYVNDVFLEADEFNIVMDKNTLATVRGKKWHGAMLVRKTGRQTLMLVNVLPVEEYVEGVVENEVPTSWPLAALKAQAIASRTFSVFRMLAARDKPYDVRPNFQSYAIPQKKAEMVARAVEETRGVVMVYKGRVFPSFYHGMCGGVTDYAGNNWNYPFKFPENVQYCKFCSENVEKATWTCSFAIGEVERKLKAAGCRVADIIDIEPYKVSTVSERATEFAVYSRLETMHIRTNALREALGFHNLKSNYFKIRKKDGRFIFIGLGRGHGAGMCQHGARAMAESGDSFETILKYYYPGVDFRKVSW